MTYGGVCQLPPHPALRFDPSPPTLSLPARFPCPPYFRPTVAFPVHCAFTYNKRWPNNGGLVRR